MVAVIIVIFSAIGYWYYIAPPGQVTYTDVEIQNAFFQKLLATPIVFYGKVVDEKNNPIAGVDVTGQPSQTMVVEGATNNPVLPTKSDDNGQFCSSTHGGQITICVSKPGYYDTESKSQFCYIKNNENYSPHSDVNNPAIFVMCKVGVTEDVIPVKLQIHMPIDGSVTQKRLVTPTQLEFQLQGWDQYGGWPPHVNEPYDWKAILSIPGGGGFVERKGGKYDFEAPEKGYTNQIEVDMPTHLGGAWRSGYGNSYYMRTADNRYGRVEIFFSGDRTPTVDVEGYINPIPGHRNLEHSRLE